MTKKPTKITKKASQKKNCKVIAKKVSQKKSSKSKKNVSVNKTAKKVSVNKTAKSVKKIKSPVKKCCKKQGIQIFADDILDILKPLHLKKNASKPEKNVAIKCNSELCDHSENQPQRHFEKKLETLQDLIDFCNVYQCKNNKVYHGIDMTQKHTIILALRRLQKVVGIDDIKNQIIDQILFLLQDFSNDDMFHSIITGPPGCGKTTIANILADIYASIGILKTKRVTIARRQDLIAEYIGQTAIKTQSVIDQAEDGVLLIDEAYQLSSQGPKDYAKECVDTLNQNLTERRNFVCIIAGYKDSIENDFLKMNEGLERRFPFRYHIDGYKSNELMQIFFNKIDGNGLFTNLLIGTVPQGSQWQIDDENKNKIKKNIFDDNQCLGVFKNFGGDIENFIVKCKINHSKRTITQEKDRFRLSFEDVNNVYKQMKKESQEKQFVHWGLYA